MQTEPEGGLSNLFMQVGAYLEKVTPNGSCIIVVEQGTTMLNVLKELVESKVHRVWVVDAGHHPVGVITLTDILSVFLK